MVSLGHSPKGIIAVVVFATTFMQMTMSGSSAVAQDCTDSFVRGSIGGERSRVKLSLGGRSAGCNTPSLQTISAEPQPYFTYLIACSPDRQAAMEGLCSATPCPTSFFAFRTIHFPDGSSEPAGFRCVTLDQATA
jgi:hypothetical protein